MATPQPRTPRCRAGTSDRDTDALHLDVVVTGSQKGWMSPPGLAMIAVSGDAYAAAANAKLPRWYFDFARERKFQERNQTYTTPPVSVMYAVQEGLRMILEEGDRKSTRLNSSH